jgi:hypothetical protein
MSFDILALNLCSETPENDRGDFIDKKIDIFDLNIPQIYNIVLEKVRKQNYGSLLNFNIFRTEHSLVDNIDQIPHRTHSICSYLLSIQNLFKGVHVRRSKEFFCCSNF